MDPFENITKLYGNKLRLRVCGLCIDEQNRILMVKHSGIGEEGELWIPPGGGMEWGQSAPENLRREFREETGLEVAIGEFLFVHEHLEGPLHAVELFFRVQHTAGVLAVGSDPEMLAHQQLISDVHFFGYQELQALGREKLHAMFRHYNSVNALINARGYFKYGK